MADEKGIGMSEEETAKVFTRFYRSAAVSDEKGVGIGLYPAREIVSKEGGYIKVSSQKGRGSAFSVFQPKSHHNGIALNRKLCGGVLTFGKIFFYVFLSAGKKPKGFVIMCGYNAIDIHMRQFG